MTVFSLVRQSNARYHQANPSWSICHQNLKMTNYSHPYMDPLNHSHLDQSHFGYTFSNHIIQYSDISKHYIDRSTTSTPKFGIRTTHFPRLFHQLQRPHHHVIFMIQYVAVVDVARLRSRVEPIRLDEFKDCMDRLNDAEKCLVHKHARGKHVPVPEYERGWKNVFKLMPGYVTKLYVSFAYIHTDEPYGFDATAEPGYVYHCHILDHEDNVMMRPLKLVK